MKRVGHSTYVKWMKHAPSLGCEMKSRRSLAMQMPVVEALKRVQNPEGVTALPGGWNGRNAGALLPWMGLPISPGPLPLTCALSSASNLTNTPRGPSSRTVNDPLPFWRLPSVSQMSSISWIWTGASFAGFSCSTWRSIVLMLWNPLPVLPGLLAVNCLQA